MTRVPPALVHGLLDDAAIFPPGNAPVPAAIASHREHDRAWYADLVGPFLCPAARLPELRAALATDGTAGPMRVGLLVPADPGSARSSAQTVLDDAGLLLAGIEVAPSPDARAADAVLAALPADVPVAVEVPRGRDASALLRVLAARGARAKLRTGGTTPDAFPPIPELAGTLRACVTAGVPLKCTAGLHALVRHDDPSTGFRHHGFGNVLAAVGRALDGGDVDAALAEHRPPAVVDAVVGLEPSAVRRAFVSFGTCSVREPVDDLVAHGLLAPVHAA